MALVLLPCDLPTWPTLQRHLNAMKREVRTAVQLKDALLKIYNLCNTSLEPDEETLGDQKVFDVFCDEVVDTWLSDDERQDLFDTQLPTMVDYALQLKSLKPLRGLHFSLQQQSDRVEIDRRFAASLVAHAFFSTFPRRTLKTHPTLQDFNFAGHFFQHLHRRSQRAKLRSVLHYFQRLNERPPEGHVTFARQVMSGREWCTLEEWLQCRRPLCPLVVRHDGRVEYPSPTSSSDLSPSSLSNNINNNRPTVGQSTEPPAGIRVCFASRRIGGTFLDDGTSQECAAFSSHPELLSLLPYVESLEDNEAITASGLCTYSIIHDLKNKAVFDAAAAAGQQTATTKATTTTPIQQVTLTQTPMCLIDAEDYSDLPIRQYEEDNVLRELNKAYLGFSQHYPDAAAAGLEQQQPQEQLQQRLPPVGASRDSSPSSRQASTIIDHTISQDWADLTRSTTLVASSGDPSSPRPSLCPSMPSQDLQSHLPGDETDRGRPAAAAAATQPTLLYGGGRNAPLTLAKATVVKQILTQQQQQPAKAKDGLPDLSKLPSSVTARKAGSVYASCHSQDDELNSSTEEFRSANTSLDEDEMRPALINRLQQRHSAGDSNQDGREDNKSRSQSTESDSSPEDRRPESRGFALDSHNEEDSFSGDGLEREKRWLDHFRERRGPRSNSRSVPKDSSSSSKDSSRYSFSTEFSSELDELYDQFSHWLEDPKSGESGQQNGRNAAVFRFAHGLLKRALSDSFASVALNIENLSAHPETRMKDIKLSSSSEIRRGSTQRSWSLNEHVGDERLALQLAREMVEREIPMEEQVLPMPDIVPLLPVDAIEEEETLDPLDQEQPEKSPANQKKKDSLGNSKSKVACQLVSIVLEQRLAEVELELQVPGSSRISSAHHHAARPSLINTRCPGRGCPAPLRTQESVAWEYHQNPSCSFNIRLDRGLAVTATRPAAKCRLAAILGHSANPLGQTATTTTTPTTPLTTTPCCTPSTTSTNQSPLGSAAKMTNGNPRDDEKPFRHVNGGLLPIITGNWGCGSSGGGDAQLKSMLQWLAASRSGAPSLVYYTAGASSVVKLDIVCRVIMDRQWTVGDLAGALLRYCRARLDPRRLDLISRLETHYQAVIAGSSSGVDAAQRHMSLSTSAECPGANPGTDRLLFDELLGQYPLKQTEL
ncbi:uncharacterized protein LOC124343574 isoform X5 [Daphnia pulicaria]|uniref:uncharacterized protein LOC124343574 isoform X5 n=1 Tax=Daphnia pulicaria TaxID=35523 RepID=UPI001EEC8C15|nr:uncharacterized protein LOC124343574 isoform X5 [Daphnia pulicaria]